MAAKQSISKSHSTHQRRARKRKPPGLRTAEGRQSLSAVSANMSAPKETTRKSIPRLPKARIANRSSLQTTPADNTEWLRTLTEIFNKLIGVEDVLIVCGKALQAEEQVEQNEEIGNILRRYATDSLFVPLQRLSRLIEGLGGETSMTEGADEGDHE